MVAAALTVISDWVAVGAAAETIGEKSELWAQCLLLPGLTGPNLVEDEEEARTRHYAVLALLPQVGS